MSLFLLTYFNYVQRKFKDRYQLYGNVRFEPPRAQNRGLFHKLCILK